jgi:hypothetical protein
MVHTSTHTANTPAASPQDEWLDTLLVRDAQQAHESCSDTDFVNSVIAALDTPASSTPVHPTYPAAAWAYRLLLVFEALSLTALCLSAPTALKAWLNFAQSPLDLSGLLEPALLGFTAGLTLVALGAVELSRTCQGDFGLAGDA